MKRIISLLIAILVPISSYADTCGASLTGPFNADEAGRLCAVFGSAVNHDLLPSADGTYDLGSSTLEWQDGFFDGTLTTDALVNSGTSTLTGAVSIGSTLNGTSSTGLGWVIASGANTACNTTCGISACAFGADTATDFDAVNCADATADVCICTGSTS